MNELELTITRTIAASREKVFNAWLSPEKLAQFMRPPLADAHPARVENDPVEGGRFSIIMTAEGKDIPHGGTYLEIDPYSRLAFTWQSPYSLDDSVVTIDLTDAGADGTGITLKQVKFKDESARDGHEKGWGAIIGRLEEALAAA